MSSVPGNNNNNNNDNSNEIAEFFQGTIISDFIQNTTQYEKLVVDFEQPTAVLFMPPTDYTCVDCGGPDTTYCP